VAIEVSGCHLVLVICGPVAAAARQGGGHGPRDVPQPQDLGHVATGKSFPGAPPRPASTGPHAP